MAIIHGGNIEIRDPKIDPIIRESTRHVISSLRKLDQRITDITDPPDSGDIPPFSTGTWVPAWASDSGAQPSIGNGTLEGSYMKYGRIVVAMMHMVIGGTTDQGENTVAWNWTLPFPMLRTAMASSFQSKEVLSHANVNGGGVVWNPNKVYMKDATHWRLGQTPVAAATEAGVFLGRNLIESLGSGDSIDVLMAYVSDE